jgi:hypothetical protein
VQENSIFVEIFKQNSTMKHFIDTLERLKIKFSFLPTRKKKDKECLPTLAHLPAFPSHKPDTRKQAKEPICLPAYF